ncbi:E6 [Ailuropoda melanoleuca papillomavirus 4]|uniref:Protein E6 n=1 Tax=Ailuropoda melanoleuca papillomavirus 4 TaxID=2016453 RepID=A0A220IGG1_9PAPI|nr:E6 [Ailuropoda melanoleuca papillomavirus 4]ASH99069.1 E6 [Ailuropoda melanoleuca papillomavirus 4]
MARPTSVKGLAALTGVPLVDFLLPCHFCKRFLTNIEKLRFDESPLRLLWREGCAFGCCLACIRLCSKIERSCHKKKHTNCRKIKEKFGKEILEVGIRCSACYKRLHSREIQKSANNQRLFEVRGKVRGFCDLCYLWT